LLVEEGNHSSVFVSIQDSLVKIAALVLS
jgi:hypothetical protein